MKFPHLVSRKVFNLGDSGLNLRIVGVITMDIVHKYVIGRSMKAVKKNLTLVISKLIIPRSWGSLAILSLSMLLILLSNIMASVIALSVSNTERSVSESHLTDLNLEELEEEVITNVMGHVKNLTSLGSRVTGYPGFYKAAEYIASYFRKLGLSPGGIEGYFQPYEVMVPIDQGSKILVPRTGEEIKAYALWPNGIQTCLTPPKGITGKLIYVGKGSLKEFNGKDVAGSIVLMDFNSGDNWLNAARLGARAVIFIEPGNTTYHECIRKFLDTPFYFPRLYVRRDDGLRLIKLAQNGESVTIFVNMRYQVVKAYNVIGILNGTTNPNDVIIVAAHYDTWSVVPSYSYGAHEAVSVALLLELARYFSEHKPLQTVWFVALSGHWEALAGGREFVEHYYFSQTVQRGKVRPWLFIEIGSLSPDSRGLALLCNSYFSRAAERIANLPTRFAWVIKLYRSYTAREDFVNYIKSMSGVEPRMYIYDFFDPQNWWGTEECPYLLNSELVVGAGCVGFSICSLFGHKLWQGIPLNDLPQLERDMDKLRPQIFAASYIIASFAFQDGWEHIAPPWNQVSPRRIYLTPYEAIGFVTLKGKVLCFNLTEGWYQPVPHAIVQVYFYPSGAYSFAKIITMTDENGTYLVHGLIPTRVIVRAPGGFTSPFGNTAYWTIRAWVINSTDGSILYATDMGIYGAKAIPPIITPVKEVEEKSVVVMKCVSISIFDVIHPGTLRGLVRDPRSAETSFGGGEVGTLLPLDFFSESELQFYSVYQNLFEPVSMVFVPKGSRIAIVAVPTVGRRPTLVILNASSDHPEGYGIIASKPLSLTFSVYRVAYDMYMLSMTRYSVLKAYEVRRLSAEKALSEGHQLLKKAEYYYKRKVYDKAYGEALAALALAYKLYNEEVMPLVDDTSATCLLFFLLLPPVTVMLETLIVRRTGKMRLVSILLIGILMFTAFYYVHPALKIMSSSSMGILGALLFLLFLIVLGIVASEAEKLTKMIEARIMGIHRVEVSKIGIIITSITYSLEYMRKHPLRTILTLATILSISTALISLTSISYYTGIDLVYMPGYRANYDGLLIIKGRGEPPEGPMQLYMVEYLKSLTGENFSLLPRVWYYPQAIPGGPRRGTFFYVMAEDSPSLHVECKAALGLSPEESSLLIQKYGIGMGFLKADQLACILPDNIAQQLNVSVGDRVIVFGRSLVVTGIIYTGPLQTGYLDLDGYPITPIDPSYVESLCRGIEYVLAGQEAVEYPPLPWREIIIVPYQLALNLYGYVSSISIRPGGEVNHEYLVQLGSKIALYTDVDVYISWKGQTFKCSRVSKLHALGGEALIPLLAIGGLNMTIVILSNIRERRRDVFVLSSLGLSPTGIMSMFLTESSVYAFLGAIIGYLIGIAINRLLIEMKFLPSYFVFNFASVSIISAMLTILISSFVATLYPAYVVGKLVTPSLRRRWELPTKPRGDEWDIPLILRVPSKEEVYGILHFMKEYFTGFGAETKFFRVREIKKFSIKNMQLDVIVDLAPYEQHVSQIVRIKALMDKNNFTFNIYIKRLSGSRRVWKTANRFFIDSVRKQLLLWRTLPLDEVRRHIASAKK